MRRLALEFLILGLLIVLITAGIGFATGDKIARVYGPNTREQIQKSFKMGTEKKYKVMVLGNSRMYRGVNPSMFGVDSFNFSHDNDTYNQIYYKLVFLKDKGKLPEYVVLGTDYFQFSFISATRNEIYGEYFNEEYLKDYGEKLDFNLDAKMNIFQSRLKLGIACLFQKEKEHSLLRDNGQFIIDGTPGDNDKIKRDSSRLEIQEKYFEKIIDFLHKEKIGFLVVMPPLRDIELENYSDEVKREFKEYIMKNISVENKYITFEDDNNFTIEDFSDKTHLNSKGADRFSKMVWEYMKGEITLDGKGD